MRCGCFLQKRTKSGYAADSCSRWAYAKYRGDIDALIGVEKPRAEGEEDVLTIAARSGLDRSSLGKPPAYEALITAAGGHLGNSNLYRVAWKGASGLAHGRLWATAALLRLDPLGDEVDGAFR